MDKFVQHDCKGAEVENLGITVRLETPCGQESFRLPSCQLGALRTYLKILTCMNAERVLVTPEKGKERESSYRNR